MQLDKSADVKTKYMSILKMPLQHWVMDSAVLEVYRLLQCVSTAFKLSVILDFVNKHHLLFIQLRYL